MYLYSIKIIKQIIPFISCFESTNYRGGGYIMRILFILSLLLFHFKSFAFEIIEVNEKKSFAVVRGKGIDLKKTLYISNAKGESCSSRVIKKKRDAVFVSTEECIFQIRSGDIVSSKKPRLRGVDSDDSIEIEDNYLAEGEPKQRKSLLHGVHLNLGYRSGDVFKGGLSHLFLLGRFEPYYALFLSNRGRWSGDWDKATYSGVLGIIFNFVDILDKKNKSGLWVPYFYGMGGYVFVDKSFFIGVGLGSKFFVSENWAINIAGGYAADLGSGKTAKRNNYILNATCEPGTPLADCPSPGMYQFRHSPVRFFELNLGLIFYP